MAQLTGRDGQEVTGAEARWSDHHLAAAAPRACRREPAAAAAAFRFGGTPQPQPRPPITAIGDALDVFDFDEAARRTLPAAHYGYLATGTDDDATLRANRDAFARYHLRPRRLVNVGNA